MDKRIVICVVFHSLPRALPRSVYIISFSRDDMSNERGCSERPRWKAMSGVRPQAKHLLEDMPDCATPPIELIELGLIRPTLHFEAMAVGCFG